MTLTRVRLREMRPPGPAIYLCSPPRLRRIASTVAADRLTDRNHHYGGARQHFFVSLESSRSCASVNMQIVSSIARRPRRGRSARALSAPAPVLACTPASAGAGVCVTHKNVCDILVCA